MSKRPNTSIKRPLKINEGTEIETTLNTQKSTQSNIKNSKKTLNSNNKFSKNI